MSDEESSDRETPKCPVCDARNHRTFRIEEVKDEGRYEDDRTQTVRELAGCQNCGNVYDPGLRRRN